MQWDFLGRGLVLFPTSDVRGFYHVAGTYKIPNYPHALSHTVCGDHKRIYFLETFLMRIAAYKVLFYSNKVEGFTTSRSLRVFYNYPTHTLPFKHINKQEDLKFL